jgi:hypothetical protein
MCYSQRLEFPIGQVYSMSVHMYNIFNFCAKAAIQMRTRLVEMHTPREKGTLMLPIFTLVHHETMGPCVPQ